MRRVIKVGGSLLLQANLVSALNEWLSKQSPAENLVIFGGGELIDAIRHLDQVHPGNPMETHWTCVGLLDVTFHLATQWFDWNLVRSSADFQRGVDQGFTGDRPTLIRVSAFYHREARIAAERRLPLDWTTTTDSIAALLALQSKADEVILLKSCDVDQAKSIQDLAESGVVDMALPRIASQISELRAEKLNCG